MAETIGHRVIPLYEGWKHASGKIIERKEYIAYSRDQARFVWHRDHPWGIYGAILRIEPIQNHDDDQVHDAEEALDAGEKGSSQDSRQDEGSVWQHEKRSSVRQ